MLGCQQVFIKSDKDTQAVLEYLCYQSAKLSNCGIYYSRQLYFTHWQNSEPCSRCTRFWEPRIRIYTTKRSIRIKLSKS